MTSGSHQHIERCSYVYRPDGKKKAFVRLDREVDALDIANKFVFRVMYHCGSAMLNCFRYRYRIGFI